MLKEASQLVSAHFHVCPCFWRGQSNHFTLCQALPRLRFNKEGNLLAVTTADNGFKILANADGLRTLRALGSRPPFEAFRPQYEASSMKVPTELFNCYFYFVIHRLVFRLILTPDTNFGFTGLRCSCCC
jgi:hypothetical protein